MRIGFDAKRAFFNSSGLGNYSRNTISMLCENNPELDILLFSPKFPKAIPPFAQSKKVEIVCPKHQNKLSQWIWRSLKMSTAVANSNVNVFHGLSNEIPIGLQKRQIPSVVTIHDLIFLRFPELYKPIDRKIYYKKTLYACKNADRIIAVSHQTKNDIVQFLGINPERIEVIYQPCNPAFLVKYDISEKALIRAKYELPQNFILFVGTIEKRKNVLNLLKAMHEFNIDVPLVIVGKSTPYLFEITAYAQNNKLQNKLFIRHNVTNNDLPALYQNAMLFVYPSIFEGFGIPVLEAISSGVPVITSNTSSLPEAAGTNSYFIDPMSVDSIGKALSLLLGNKEMRDKMIASGYEHASMFSGQIASDKLVKLYHSLL